MTSRLAFIALAACGASGASHPASIELGTLAHDHERWTAGRDRIDVTPAGVDVRFTVSADTVRTERPELSVWAYTPGNPGDPAPLRVRLVEDRSNREIATSPPTCHEGFQDPNCFLPVNAGADPTTYRIELRADRSVTASIVVLAYEPLER